MPKGMVILDIPESCRECRLFVQGVICSCAGSEFKTIEECMEQAGWLRDHYAEGRHDQCPIRPLPKKDKEDYFPDEFQDGIKTGWNMCIDALVEGGEINE